MELIDILIAIWVAVSLTGLVSLVVDIIIVKREIRKVLDCDCNPRLKLAELLGFVSIVCCPVLHIFGSYCLFAKNATMIELMANEMASHLPPEKFARFADAHSSKDNNNNDN